MKNLFTSIMRNNDDVKQVPRPTSYSPRELGLSSKFLFENILPSRVFWWLLNSLASTTNGVSSTTSVMRSLFPILSSWDELLVKLVSVELDAILKFLFFFKNSNYSVVFNFNLIVIIMIMIIIIMIIILKKIKRKSHITLIWSVN